VYAVLVEKAGHFRKKLGILDSINTGLAKWSSLRRFKKNPGISGKCPAFSENVRLKTFWVYPVF
jgi:hypothetical protein